MFTSLFKGRCRRCGVRIPRLSLSWYELRFPRRTWCDRCLDLNIAEMRAREERTRSEALNLVGRWLDRAPAYQPTHLARDAHRHAALTGHRPIEEPQVHTLDIDDALDALTRLRLEHQEIFDEDWPAPFAWHVEFGTISFEERTRRALDRFAEDPDAAVPRHLDALHRYTTEWTSSVDGLVVTYVGSVYRSSDRVQVVWIETSRYVKHG